MNVPSSMQGRFFFQMTIAIRCYILWSHMVCLSDGQPVKESVSQHVSVSVCQLLRYLPAYRLSGCQAVTCKFVQQLVEGDCYVSPSDYRPGIGLVWQSTNLSIVSCQFVRFSNYKLVNVPVTCQFVSLSRSQSKNLLTDGLLSSQAIGTDVSVGLPIC